MAGLEILKIPDAIRSGTTHAFRIAATYATGDDVDDAKALSGCARAIFDTDPDRFTSGTASAGSTTTLTDTARNEAANFWVFATIKVTQSDVEYESEITGSTAAGVLTFHALPITVASGDTYVIEGYPLLSYAAGTVGGDDSNEIRFTATPGNALGRPGDRRLVVQGTFSDGDIEKATADFRVVASMDE